MDGIWETLVPAGFLRSMILVRPRMPRDKGTGLAFLWVVDTISYWAVDRAWTDKSTGASRIGSNKVSRENRKLGFIPSITGVIWNRSREEDWDNRLRNMFFIKVLDVQVRMWRVIIWSDFKYQFPNYIYTILCQDV
jgi:hypothetical protein